MGDINVSGILRVDGSSGTAGQVLTSNGGLSPSWQSAPNSGFHAEHSGQIIPQFTQAKVNFSTEVFDDGTDFNSGRPPLILCRQQGSIILMHK